MVQDFQDTLRKFSSKLLTGPLKSQISIAFNYTNSMTSYKNDLSSLTPGFSEE